MNGPAPSPLRILHAPRNIAGQAGDVVAALRRLGHAAELWEEAPEAFGRAADRTYGADIDARTAWRLVEEAAARFDVVHFHFGRTLVPRTVRELPPMWDLPLYRALGRRVYFTFHGSDIRIGRIHRQTNPWGHLFRASSDPDDDRIERSLQVMRTYADGLFVTSVNYLDYVPDGDYLPRVIDLGAWPELPVAQRDRPVVVHAPTRRGTKGSDIILGELEALHAEGVPFELRLIEGQPHEQVREELAAADVLVDNVIAGAYGVVSLEAMACGKVAVANLSEAVRAVHPDAPVVHVDPVTFRATMRRLLRDPAERTALAQRGRPYVAAVHDADRIARQLVEVYRAPRQPVRPKTIPDWIPAGRRIDQPALEARVERLEADLARSRRREEELRARLGLGPAGLSPARKAARAVLPHGVRARILRIRG